MTKKIVIHNAETNEIIEREMTKEEELTLKESQKLSADINKKIEADNALKTQTRQSILEKLGLTEEEMAILLG